MTPAMELGGNAPAIVFDDADLEAAVEGVMLAKLRNIGEACTAANRIYLQARDRRGLHRPADRADGGAAGSATGWRRGWTSGRWSTPRPATRWRPSSRTRWRRARGCCSAGKVPEGKGFFYPATVLADVPDDGRLPAGRDLRAGGGDPDLRRPGEVIAKANATEYGLVAYVFTGDLRRGLRVCERLEFGMVGLNRGMVSDPAAPFGGMKQSGLGREGGHEGIHEFMEIAVHLGRLVGQIRSAGRRARPSSRGDKVVHDDWWSASTPGDVHA